MEATIDSVLDKMHVALDQNGDPAKVFELADFAANMVDQTLMTGDTGEAFRLASHSRPQIPASVGADQLPGSVNLKFTPWESRKLYEYSVYILFSAVYSGRSEYIPWLVEALQIAFLGERFAVERVLRTLALPENKVERLVSHWPRKIRELKHLEAVLQGLANLESQHWMLNFLEAAAKDNAFLERARDWKILILTEECRNAGEYSKRLAALLATGEPVLSYGVATVIKRENFFDSDVRLAVVSQLQNPNSSVMTQKFLVEVLKKLSLFGVKVDLDRKYVAAIRSRFRDFEMPILDAFEYNEFANHELSVDISSQQLTVNAHRINAAEWDGKIHCLYQRRVKATAEDALSTDEDEYGLILVDLKSQQSKVFLLPVNFSIQSTCIVGAKRKIESIVRSSTHIYVAITVPFFREDRSGFESLLFSYCLNENEWAHWTIRDGELTPNKIVTKVDCETLERTAWATLKFFEKDGKIAIENNCTGYHESAEADVRSFPSINDLYLGWTEPTTIKCEQKKQI